MIAKKYIELINKEIDGLISSDEKSKLDGHLLENPDAKNYYDQIVLTNQYLSFLPDQDPSENLKKTIINSINFSKYSPKARNKSAWNFLGTSKFKLAYTFASGVFAAIIVFALFFNNNDVNLKDVSGTIGGSDANVKTIEEIPLNFSGILGKIELEQLGNNIRLNVSSSSDQDFKMIIKYPDSIEFENIKPGLSGNIELSKGKTFVKISSNGNQQYSLLFSKNNSVDSGLQIMILDSGKTVYDYKVSLR